jgi:hypothetical protein
MCVRVHLFMRDCACVCVCVCVSVFVYVHVALTDWVCVLESRPHHGLQGV